MHEYIREMDPQDELLRECFRQQKTGGNEEEEKISGMDLRKSILRSEAEA